MKQYLAALPFRLDLKPLGGHTAGPTVVLVHGTPTLNTLYWTEDRPDSFCLKMAQHAGAKAGDVIAFGHTHKPWHREVEGDPLREHRQRRSPEGRRLARRLRAPRDRHRRRAWSSCASSTTSTRRCAAIRESELPGDFAEYLRTGGKPAPVGEA